jgi:prepilin-type N-terminal cleavage/methylation domain-containing protein
MTRLLMRVRDRRGDEGMSLVELLVAMVVFSSLMAVVTATAIMTMQSSRNTDARNQDLGRIRLTLENMSKMLRTAAQPPVPAGVTPPNAFISANARDVSFYGYNQPGAAPSIIRYYVNATNQLVEEVTPSTQCAWPYTWNAASKKSRTLARSLTPNQAVFSFNAQPTTPSPQGSPLPTSGTPAAVGAGDLVNVDNVLMTLSIDVPTSPDIPPTVGTTQVQLRNHDAASNQLPETAC